MYHVQYTSSRGITSHANFTIAIQGDSRPDKLYPTIAVGEKTVSDTIVFVQPGDDVTLTATSRIGWSTSTAYVWSNGKKTQSITLSKVKKPQVLTCTYTNQNKVKSTITFHIYVQENCAMPEGEYYIINRATGEYLANDGSAYPSCLASTDEAARLWHIAPDGERYKITSLLDDRFLGGTGSFPTTDYNPKTHTFLFEPLQGTDHYNITRLSGTTTYWCGWKTNGRINGTNSKEPTEYPFTIVAADLTTVSYPRADVNGTKQRYTLSGLPAPAAYKGIVISNGTKVVY